MKLIVNTTKKENIVNPKLRRYTLKIFWKNFPITTETIACLPKAPAIQRLQKVTEDLAQ